MSVPRFLVTVGVLIGLVSGTAACGDDETEAGSGTTTTSAPAQVTEVKVQLGEEGSKYFVKVDTASVPAGTVKFVIDNVGTMHHELAIFKTDLAPDQLPMTDEDKVDEEKAGLLAEAAYTKPVRGDEDHRIRDGRGVDFTIDLKPGKYVLLCNLAGHYKAGQFIAFTVEGPEASGAPIAGAPDDTTTSPPSADVTGTPVAVKLGENGSKYFITVDTASVAAGTVTFVIDNVGTMHHELVIFKTDLPPGQLPVTNEDKVDEEALELIGEAVYAKPLRGDEDHRIRDGRGANFTIDLKPGKYVLVCNLAGHYTKGQFIAFTVT
jgi:uncharacterized cupredoxin-like copper-binding protein